MPDRFHARTHLDSVVWSLTSAIIGSTLLYSWTLTYPLNIDSSVHAYIASLILKGFWPYVHVWENNFPGTAIFINLPELVLFGRNIAAFHVWDILWHLAGTFFLYKIVARAATPRAAWLASIFAAIFYLSLDNLNVAQRDCYATIILLATVYVMFVRREERDLPFFTACFGGLLYSIAILIRPTNELYAAFIAAFIFLSERSGSSAAKAIVFFFCAQALILLTAIIALAFGVFGEVYTIIVRFNTEVYSHMLPLADLWYPFGKYWIFLLSILFGFFALRVRDRILWSGSLIVSLLTLIPQKRYLYQYDTTFLLLIFFSSIGWAWVFEHIRWKQIQFASIMLFTLCSIALLTRGTTQKRIFVQSFLPNPLNFVRSTTYWQYDTSSASGFAVLDSVGAYLAHHTTPNDRIQFVGEYVYPLYIADRLSATRFVTFHSIMLRNAEGKLAEFQKQWRAELLDSAKTSPPLYFVVPDAPDYARGHLNGLLGHEILEWDLTQLGEFIHTHYYVEAQIGAFTFYRRNP